MFEGDSADTCAGKFLLVSMGGWAKGLAYTDLGARTPIGASGNSLQLKSLVVPKSLWSQNSMVSNVHGPDLPWYKSPIVPKTHVPKVSHNSMIPKSHGLKPARSQSSMIQKSFGPKFQGHNHAGKNGWTALIIGAISGNKPLVESLLECEQVDVNLFQVPGPQSSCHLPWSTRYNVGMANRYHRNRRRKYQKFKSACFTISNNKCSF